MLGFFPYVPYLCHMFHCYVSLGECNSNTHFLKRIGNHFFRWSLTRPATLSVNVETKSLGFVESPRWIFGFISSWTNDPARSPFFGGETSSPNNSEIDVGYHIIQYQVSTYKLEEIHEVIKRAGSVQTSNRESK